MDTQGEDYIAHEIISRAVSIRRFSASEQSKVIEMLKRLEEELLVHLLRKDLTNIGRRNTALILRQAQEIIAEHYSNISDFVDESLPEFARSEAKFIGDTLGKVMIDLEPSLPTETYFRELMKDTLIQGAPSADWWDRQAGDTAFRFANEVRQGMIQGETVDQITKRVQKNVEPLIENNARAQVNTSIQQVAADARRETFKQNDDLIIGIKQISVLDSHTTLTCVAYSGAEWENTPEMNPIPPTTLPYNGGCPRHWNAICIGEMVRTSTGMKPIEAVAVGDLVFTHAGRYKPVTAVMRKRCESGFIRVINLESGRTIRVTDEHPILALELGWRRADSLAVGDKLYQYRDKTAPMGIGFLGIERNPQDYPSFVHASDVFSQVLLQSGKMALSINLNDDLGRINSEISHAFTENDLSIECDSRKNERFPQQNLTKWQIFKLKPLNLLENAIHRAVKACRISLFHSLRMIGVIGMRFLSETPSPMVFASHGTRCLQCSHIESGSFSCIPCFDPMFLAPTGKSTNLQSEFPLNLANGFPCAEMLTSNQISHNSAISQINHFDSVNISDIRIVAYDGDVFNLSVEDDETYLIDDVIVHNCRSIEAPILKDTLHLNLPPGTRASDIGPISAETTMADFIKMRGRGFADRLLGVGRADLFMSGKMTLTQLLDQSGRPLSLKELNELHK